MNGNIETIGPSLQSVADRLETLAAGHADLMAQVGTDAIFMIVTRTRKQGIDRTGAPFPPYSTKGPIYIGPTSPYFALVGPVGRHERLSGNKVAVRTRTAFADPLLQFGSSGRAFRTDVQRTKGGRVRVSSNMVSAAFDSWADLKAKAASPLAAPGHVNLTLGGRLLGSVSGTIARDQFGDDQGDRPFGVVEAGVDVVVIGFTRAEEALIADGLIARGFEFWGVGEIQGELEALEDGMAERMETLMKSRVEDLA